MKHPGPVPSMAQDPLWYLGSARPSVSALRKLMAVWVHRLGLRTGTERAVFASRLVGWGCNPGQSQRCPRASSAMRYAGGLPPCPAAPASQVHARQKSQSSSSVSSALPMTYELPEPEKKSWFSSAFGESAARIAGFTSQISAGKSAGYPRFISALFAL